MFICVNYGVTSVYVYMYVYMYIYIYYVLQEAKLTMGDGNWVSIVLSDEFDGRPIMLVSREKAAVDWMETDFQNIYNSMPRKLNVI